MILTTTTEDVQVPKDYGHMNREELAVELEKLTAKLVHMERRYKDSNAMLDQSRREIVLANSRAEHYQAMATDQYSKVGTLMLYTLFGDRHGIAGEVYPVVFTDDIEKTQITLYLGRMEFEVRSIIGRDMKMHWLKKEHARKYSIEVGYNLRDETLIALNRTSQPAHPNIGHFICMGDLERPFEGMKLHKMTVDSINAVWAEYRPKLEATLSTANVAGGFHDGDDWSEFDNSEYYEAAAEGGGDLPVWQQCNVCHGFENMCAVCGRCAEHCRGVGCDACGEVVHSDVCPECSRCGNCGCVDGCTEMADENTLECTNCGESVNEDDFHSGCDMCAPCHDRNNHSYCDSCSTHLSGDDRLECNMCSDCHVNAGHDECFDCDVHLYERDINVCIGCSNVICGDDTLDIDGDPYCSECARRKKAQGAATAATAHGRETQTNISDTTWHS